MSYGEDGEGIEPVECLACGEDIEPPVTSYVGVEPLKAPVHDQCLSETRAQILEEIQQLRTDGPPIDADEPVDLEKHR